MRLLLGILLLSLTLLTMGYSQGANGHVKGEVWFRPFVEAENTFDNVAVPNCEVVLKSASVSKKVNSGADGHYEVDLPAGVYNVATNCAMAPNDWEYYPAVRSDFEVKPSASFLLNLWTPVKRTKQIKTRDGTDQLEYRSDDLKSEFLEIKSGTSVSRKILVRFLRRAASKELAEYQGRRDYRQDAPASVSYESLSIYADSITIEKPALHIRAVGHVIVEDGRQRRQGNEATVEFDAPDPLASLTILGAASAR
jgi:hypothetical protein